MAEGGAARGIIEDATFVGKDDSTGIHGGSERLPREGSLHLTHAPRSDETVAGNADRGGERLIVGAGRVYTSYRDVGVHALELGLGGLPVLEGVELPATVAAEVLGGARDELLLRERQELASVDLVDALESAGGRERPARAAVALILDRGDRASFDPVDLVSVPGLVEDLVMSIFLRLSPVAEQSGLLSSGPVRELVVAKGVAVALSVALLDELIVRAEEDKASVELLDVCQLLPVLSQVVHVLELHGIEGRGSAKSDCSGEIFHPKYPNYIINEIFEILRN